MAKKNAKRPTNQEEEYDNHLTGVLFKNSRKRKGKKDPQITGNVVFSRAELIKLIKENPDAEELKFWVNGWTGESSQGKWYTSLKLNFAEPQEEEEEEEEEDDFEPDDEFIPEKKKKKKGTKNSDDDFPF